MTPPDRSLEQRRAALATANRIRGWRRDVKRQVRDVTRVHGRGYGATIVGRLIHDPGPMAVTWPARDVLMLVPGWGVVHVRWALVRAGVSDSKTLGGLSPRQREALVAMVAEYARTRVAA